MNKIDTKARASYFAKERTKAIGASIYTTGYKDGYLQALEDVREAIQSQPNNKARIMGVINLIKVNIGEYGDE